jgi:hypothetical protein
MKRSLLDLTIDEFARILKEAREGRKADPKIIPKKS